MWHRRFRAWRAALHPIGSEKVKGISAEIPIFEYRGAGAIKAALDRGPGPQPERGTVGDIEQHSPPRSLPLTQGRVRWARGADSA
jgi:hypothetical protein